MKNFLSKPKIIIPIAAVIALVIGILTYKNIGVAPKVDVTLSDQSETAISPGTSVDLSFNKAGRVESVSVKEGDKVSAGEVLAKLSAPDALGLVNQAKSALALAQAQYAALNLDYAKTKEQQDTIVANAYQTLLKTEPEAVAKNDPSDNNTTNYPLPVITGNYLLGQEGTITIKTFQAEGGMAFTASGLISDTDIITGNPTPLDKSGLSIQFAPNLPAGLTWTISIPNQNSPSYAANKNAYDLAVANRDKTLSEIEQNIGTSGNQSVAQAQVSAAEGSYEAALGAYQNNVITSPSNGTVSFVDPNLKPGQSVAAGKRVISITVE